MWRRGAVIAVAACVGGADPASGSIERLEIKSREAFHASRNGPYVKIEGVVTGSLAPSGEPIPGLENAARRPDGRVE